MSQAHDRIPALDGLRGIAVLVVIISRFQAYPLNADGWLEKLWVGLVSLGYLGVDLFFVLSGFLITGILLKHRTSEHRFSAFYMRRALRILPLYYGLCALVLIALPLIGRGPEDSGQPVFNLLFLQNFKGLVDASEHLFLGPTWSLAIEEQFYLVWPFVIWMLGSRRAFYAIVGILAASVLSRAGMYLSGVNVEHIYLWTFSRLDGITLGSILAIARSEPEHYRGLLQFFRRQTPVTLTLGLSIAAVSILTATHHHIAFEPGMMLAGFLLMCMALTGLVLKAIENERFAKAISGAPLRSCGRYSYAMYLIHTPVIITLNEVSSMRPLNIVVGLIVTYILGALSWWLFESRILSLGRFFTYDRPPSNPPTTTGKQLSPAGTAG